MKKINFLFLILLIISNSYAQEGQEKNALFNANEMAKSYNSRDYKKYVDYLAPAQYGNDPANKEKFVKMWETITAKDTSKMKIIKVLKFGIFNDQQQVLIQVKKNNRDLCVYGISDDNGKNWVFTQLAQMKGNFNGVLNLIPSLDKSFATLVDPNFGKRINYEIGKTIAPFTYNDINDNSLSSASLKGKIIILNFWSITCGPCIMEMPELNNLVEKQKEKPVVFIAPAFYSPKEYIVNKFLPQHPFNYQIVEIKNDDDYNVISFPTHVIIDQNLKIIDVIMGYSPGNIKRLEDKITELQKL